MPHCVAVGCYFQSKGSGKTDTSLHSFPKDKKRRKVWEAACGRTQLPKDPRLCSLHFSPDAFQSFSRPQLVRDLTNAFGFKRRLKHDAVPTVFPHRKPKSPRMWSENRAKKREREHALDSLLASRQQRLPLATAASTSFADPELEGTALAVIDKSDDLLDTNQLQIVEESVGVQCSPSKTDSATQTDVTFTSDAAVQWPTDVFYPINKDHVYATVSSVKERELEEASTSQDLFLSEDETSEGSQPGFRQTDSEYTVSSSELSQGTHDSQASLDNHEQDRIFLVYEKQLKELIQRCTKCGSLIIKEDMKELSNEGSQLTLELSCANGCMYRWQSQPFLRGAKGAGNLLLAASVFFSGIHFAKFERFCNNMNLKTITEDTYSSLRNKYVFPVVKKTWENDQSELLTHMKLRGTEVVLCGDGRCDSPGHSAKYCTYTFIDVESQKVADFKVVSCTQVSSSNAMEIKGFQDALRTIEENGVKVSTISTDRHPQIVKEMRVSNPEKHHEFDPWHVTKGVSKKLAAAAKRKECERLGEWISSIINHLWWSAQTCEGNAELLKEKWISVIHHVTNRHDWPGNRHYHQCAHEPLDEMSQRTKLWLSQGSEDHKALVRIVKDKKLLKDLDHLTRCIHTTTLEVYHSMYLKYLPKSTHFGYDVMIHASMLAALDHNNNACREQAILQDGESAGEPKFKIAWSKVHKAFRARPVAVKKDYSYMTAMVADVLALPNVQQNMETRVERTHIMAPQQRQPRSQIIFQTQLFSRFK